MPWRGGLFFPVKSDVIRSPLRLVGYRIAQLANAFD